MDFLLFDQELYHRTRCVGILIVILIYNIYLYLILYTYTHKCIIHALESEVRCGAMRM